MVPSKPRESRISVPAISSGCNASPLAMMTIGLGSMIAALTPNNQPDLSGERLTQG